MGRVVVTAMLSLLLLAPVSAKNHYAHAVASVQPLVWAGDNHCTTFSINEAEGYWSTCNHCVVGAKGQPMYIAGELATVLMVNEANDTAVLVSAAQAPRLRLSPHAPRIATLEHRGEPLTIIGHPFGLVGLVQPAFVTRGEFINVFEDEEGVWGMYDLTAAGGNSGSPVLGRDGVIGTLNFGWSNAGRYGGGTRWEILRQLFDANIWER
jgi:hypothetical protein